MTTEMKSTLTENSLKTIKEFVKKLTAKELKKYAYDDGNSIMLNSLLFEKETGKFIKWDNFQDAINNRFNFPQEKYLRLYLPSNLKRDIYVYLKIATISDKIYFDILNKNK